MSADCELRLFCDVIMSVFSGEIRVLVRHHSFIIEVTQSLLLLFVFICFTESVMSVVAGTISRSVVSKCRPNWGMRPLTHLYVSSTGFGYSSPFPFSPSEPPGTTGTPVFPNIDFSFGAKSQDALRRNEDPNAVMVVTGANRGIGLQFVKSLVHRSKVRDVWQ
jgi:hypothetical protein